MSLSLATHMIFVLLILLLLNRFPKPTPGEDVRRVNVVLSLRTPENETKYLEHLELASSEPPEQEPNDLAAAVTGETSSPPEIPLPETPKLDLPGLTPVDANFDANIMASAADSPLGKHQYELSDAELKLIEREQNYFRNREPPGPAATIGVFGSGPLEGRRFVFVIDRSRSMGSSGLGVIDRAQKELAAAIDQLQNNHWFQVVAYNERTTTIARREMLRATDENKKLLPEFMSNLISYGATNHENGLVAALSFQPDVIVLLTDSGYPELDGGQLKVVHTLARGRVSINTIQFGSGPLQETENFMMRLASQNSGTYRYINVNDWQNE